MVCGNAQAIYTALFHHAPSNTYVRMGSECTEKVDMQLDRAAFTRFKDGVAQWRTARAGKNKAKALIEEHGFASAWAIYDQPGVAETRYEESTLIDLISKLVKYGSLSDKQWAFIGRLLANIDTRGLRDAQRAQEAAVAKAIPEEMIGRRVKIRGEVISKKLVESPYGSYMKMLVKHQDGWKVWGTVPRGLEAPKGGIVEFVASIDRSQDDEKFGFFKKPIPVVHQETSV
jgi:hypothetical protein